MVNEPEQKTQAVADLHQRFLQGVLSIGESERFELDTVCGRPSKPELVPPKALKRRRLGSIQGRAALIHAVAHIEFNAINLALDACARFANMPERYYRDWIRVADDEARHFLMVQQRLNQLDFNYGDFPAHNGLWDMAVATADDCLARMALVPRVLEARGLDVTPAMIERLTQAGDDETVAVLEVILREEVAHVEIGTRWFNYCCDQRDVEPISTFEHLLKTRFKGQVKGPFNYGARQQAGFGPEEMAMLERLG